MVAATSEQFIDRLRESGLLSDAELEEAQQATKGLADSREIARRLVGQGLLSRWQVSKLLAGKLPAYLGKYKLIDKLTSSDDGAVFLAEHEQMDRRVILKTIPQSTGEDSDIAALFPEAARAVAALDHRNIVHIFDVDKEGSMYYLVMEYIRGEDLQKFVERNGPLGFQAAAGYMALAAGGLAHAHGHEIEHHRIKPDRLLVDAKGELKILDIGFAKLVDPHEAEARENKGPPPDVDFLAPEQATGKNKVDYRADIYALGCCLYYVLTGQLPYSDGTPEQRLKARLRRTPPDVLKSRPDAPPRLAEICAQMMATQPRERITSAEEASRQLNDVLRDLQKSKKKKVPAAAPAAPRSAEDAGEESDVSLSNFAIQIDVDSAKSKRKHKPKRPAAAATATTAAATTPSVTRSSATKPSRPAPVATAEPLNDRKIPPLVLWGSIGGAAAALLLIAVLAYLLWPESSEDPQTPSEVAETDDQTDTGVPPVPDGGGEITDNGGGAEKTPPDGNTGQPKPPAGPKLQSDTLARWRFEDGNVGAYVKNVDTGFGNPIAAQDTSGHDNHLYCTGPTVAPKISNEVPQDKLRIDGASQENKLSLDDTLPPSEDGGVRYLSTDPGRAAPKVDATNFLLAQWTVEATFRLKELGGLQTVLAKDGPAKDGHGSFALTINGEAGAIELAAVDSTGQLRTVSSKPAVTPEVDRWYHVAVVSNGKEMTLHVAVDGDEQEFQKCNATPFEGSLVDQAGAWVIGAGMAGGKLVNDALMTIDEVRISAAALGPDDWLFARGAPEVAVKPDPPKGPGDKPTTPKPAVSADTAIKFENVKVVSAICDQKKVALKPHGSADGSYLVSGDNPDKVIYTLVIQPEADVKAVTGLRLEALADPSLPGGGSGRHDKDGQFTVTDVKVSQKAPGAKDWKAIRLASAEASASADGWAVKTALDDKPAGTGWSIPADEVENSHWAVFAIDPADFFAAPPKTQLKVEIHQRRDTKFALGRFRLSLRSGNKPGEDPGQRILAAARRANPLEIAASTLSLPAIDSDVPQELGRVFVPPAELDIALQGGESGHGGKGSFSLGRWSSAEGGWEIRYQAKDGPEQVISRLGIEDENLTIRWLPPAAAQSDANFLRNCVLNIRAGDADHHVVLREPFEPEGMAVALGKGKRAKAFRHELEFPPAAEDIKLELKADGSVFGPHKYEPEDSVPVDRGEVAILLGETGDLQLKVSSTWRSDSLGLAAKMYSRAPGSDKTTPFVYERLLNEHLQRGRVASKVAEAIDLKEKLDGRKKPNNKEKAQLAKVNAFLQQSFRGQKLEQIKAQLGALTQRLDAMKNILTLAEQLGGNENAMIEVRLFRTVGDTEVDLMRTAGWSDVGAQPEGEE